MPSLISPSSELESSNFTSSSETSGPDSYLGRSWSSVNFSVLAIYQIVMRTGWIFKTESIIMPAVVDTISGAGWVRGCLPMLNRFGHSVPPLLLARRVKLLPQKKFAVLVTTGLMSVCFLLLAGIFVSGFAEQYAATATLMFLGIYSAFFICVGVNQLALTTLQGKLVEATRRGRLLLVANTIGAVTAVGCAWFLLSRWINDHSTRFDLIFGFSGILFATAALTVLFLREGRDSFQQAAAKHAIFYFADAYRVIADDSSFRRLALVAGLFGTSLMLFPHYQHLGLQRMELETPNLMWWVIIQNIGTGLFSIPVGAIADRYGNRPALKVVLLGVAVAPAVAIALLHWGQVAIRFYCLVFVLVGLTPIVFRVLQNYTLELADPTNHPRYLSTLGLCIAAPIFFSPFAGYVIAWLGLEVVFLTISALVFLGWTLTFGLREPRHQAVSDVPDELE